MIITVPGAVLTFTVDACVLTQPLASVPVTVYVVVEDGFALIVVPVVELKPAAGSHVYVAPPDAVSAMPVSLEQIAPPFGVTEITGNGFMVTLAVEESTKPE